MPRKLKELRAELRKLGFSNTRTSGSHQRWVHPLLPDLPITLAGKDGDDAKSYQEKLLKAAIKELENKQ